MSNLDHDIRGRAVKVLIVDDHAMVRDGLAALLAKESDFDVCGEAEDAGEAMRQLREKKPDLAIVDISLRCGHGIELVKQICAQDKHVKILVLSMHDESLFAERAIRAGAMGFLNKQQSRHQVVDALRSVLNGRVYLSAGMTEQMLSRTLGKTAASESPMEMLSDRELQVFEAIGRGMTVKEIASKLQLSPKTVETYRENVKSKLGAGNLTELVRQAVQWTLEQA